MSCAERAFVPDDEEIDVRRIQHPTTSWPVNGVPRRPGRLG